MKKFSMLSFFVFAASFAFSQEAVTLRDAVNSAAAKIEQEIAKGKKVAIYDFASSSRPLSDYVIDELIDIFINHKKLTVAERKRLAVVRDEMDYQDWSGEVDDDEILSRTHGMGIDFVITGQLDYDGLYWRFRIYAIDGNKRVRVASSSLHIKNNDRQLAYFGAVPNSGTPIKPAAGGGSYGDYTAGERVGTAALNTFFGVGSILQGDRLGWITFAGEGAGLGLLMAGLFMSPDLEENRRQNMAFADEIYARDMRTKTGLIIAGSATIGASVLFGFIIPFFHHKPEVRVSQVEYRPLKIEPVSTNNAGINGIRILYNIKF